MTQIVVLMIIFSYSYFFYFSSNSYSHLLLSFSIYIYSVICFILEGATVMYPFAPSVIDRVFLILIADFTLLSILLSCAPVRLVRSFTWLKLVTVVIWNGDSAAFKILNTYLLKSKGAQVLASTTTLSPKIKVLLMRGSCISLNYIE